jgi:hypothetical protein
MGPIRGSGSAPSASSRPARRVVFYVDGELEREDPRGLEFLLSR